MNKSWLVVAQRFSLLVLLTTLVSNGVAFGGDHDLPPLSEEKLKQLPISGIAYYESLRAIGRLPQPAKLPPPPSMPGRLLDPAVQWTVSATQDPTQDLQDVEPSIATINYSGQTTVIVSTKYVDIGGGEIGPRNYFAKTLDFSSFGRGAMPMPTGYNRSGDAYVAGNGTSVYAVGNVNNGATITTPNAIGLWRSTNGGSCWPSCLPGDAPVMIVNASSEWFLDKPAIAVNQSSNVYGGRIYVAYFRASNVTPGNSELRLARNSSSGTQSFDSDIVLTTGGRTGAQVICPPDGSGKIYIVYTDFDNRQLRMATAQDSSFSGLTFVSDEGVTGPRNLIRRGDPTLNGNVLAATLAAAKWNAVSGRIDVVWHERESTAPTANTDIYMTSKAPGGAWIDPFPVVYNSARDQFMPALAINPYGNVLIAFYNRYDDTANMVYRNYFVYYNDLGTRLQGDTMMTTESYDPRSQPQISGFLGDYQDANNWNFSNGNRWNSVWIRTAPSDVQVTDVQ